MVRQEAAAPCPRGRLPQAPPMYPHEFQAVGEEVVRQVVTVAAVAEGAEGGTEGLFPPPTPEEADGAR